MRPFHIVCLTATLALSLGSGSRAAVDSSAADDPASDDATGAGKTVPATVPPGTIVPIRLNRTIDASSDAKVTTMEVAVDVVLDGRLILRRGDVIDGKLHAERTEAPSVVSSVTSTTLTLDVVRAVNFCGDVLPLTFERTVSAQSRKVGGLKLRSQVAELPRGTVLAAVTAAPPRRICTLVTHAPPVPYPGEMLQPSPGA